MNKPERHPDTEVLDRLRAGLLDDQPQRKAALEQHLQQCASCRRHQDWAAQLNETVPLPDQQLDRLRRRALAAPAVKRHHRLLPLAAAAALAIAAVGLFHLLPAPESGNPQVATSNQSVPDLYEDLDFYLWLADHKAPGDSST
jgi:ferric-dicitrate binding protein FerR (iron transport regulator)